MAGVRTLHPSYSDYAPKWKRARDVVAGQDAVHKAGVAYLPKLSGQTTDDYNGYVSRAGFYNATWRTISGLRGMMFRKEPKLDVPTAIEGYLSDVTMAGQSFATFAKTVAYEVLTVGRVGILVDYPAAPNVSGITLDAAARMGLRPMMQMYQAEAIRNWKYRRIGNAYVLAMVVLQESRAAAKSEFEDEKVERYRVLDLNEEAGNTYRIRVFEIQNDKDVLIEETVPLMNGAPLQSISLQVIGADGNDITLDEPPLIDLVDLNLSHYRTNADYEHGAHFTGLPTAVISGYQGDEASPQTFSIGSQTAWVFPDPNAKATFLEFTGQGLDALEKILARKEQQMAVLGARMLADEKSQVETLGATAIKRTGENSVLSSIAISISEGLEKALTVFAQWAGQTAECEYEINREFMPVPIDAQTLTALVGAVQAGKISDADFFALMQRGDVIDAEKTFEEHQAEVEAQGPVAPVMPREVLAA